jgi:hypothetical protein
MRRRNFSLIAIVGVLALAVAGSGIATATQSGSSGAGAVAAKKKKKKKKKRKKIKKAASTITASVYTSAAASYLGVSGIISGPESCGILRSLQLVNVSTGAVLATTETSDSNVSFSFAADPKPPAGTQVQVVGLEKKTCLRSLSNIVVSP